MNNFWSQAVPLPSLRSDIVSLPLVANPAKTLALWLSVLMTVVTVFASHVPSAHADNGAQDHQADWHYTMRPSDNLSSVAKKLLNRNFDKRDLILHNRIADPNKLLPGSILKIPMNWLKQQPQPASILSSTGSVLIKRTRDTRFKVVKPDMQIRVGDELSTRKGSALIKFADGTLMRLEENSSLVFNKLSHYGETGMVDTQLRLKKGSLSTEVKPLVKGSRYEIQTPSAVAAVRGTSFRLEATPNSTKLEVTEGKVEFSHKFDKQEIAAGQGAVITKGTPRIETKRLPAPPKPMFAETNIKELPTTLGWKKEPSATAHRYQLLDSENNLNRLQDRQVDDPEIELDNLTNGNYQVAMRSIDAEGFEGADSSEEIAIDLATDIPLLLAPLDGAIINDRRPEFSWSSEQATLGRLEVAADAEFNQSVRTLNVAANTLTKLDKKLDPGTYFWRVGVPDGDAKPAFSEVQAFSVRGKMKPVKILSVNYLGSQVGLFWNGVKEAEGYILQLSDDQGFNNILKEETIGKTSAQLRLKPGKQYYARVKGIANDLYMSDFGPVKELLIKEE